MIEVLNKEAYDNIINDKVSFFESSIYGIAHKLFNNDYLLLKIKNEEKEKNILLLKEKIPHSKNYHYRMYFKNTLSLARIFEEKEIKILTKFLKKNKCLYLTIYSDGSESEKLYKNIYHITLDNIIDVLDSKVQSSINTAYKFPLNLVDVDSNNIDHFCSLTGIDKLNLTEYINQENLELKMVTLHIEDYVVHLNNQKNELLLKRAEEKMEENKDDDSILKIELEIEKIDETLNVLNNLKEKRGDTIYLAAGIYLITNNSIINYYSCIDDEFKEIKAEYYMNFKMLKYALGKGLYEYYDMNKQNILALPKLHIYESKEIIVKPISYKIYQKKGNKNA